MRAKIKDLKAKYFDWSMIRWVIVGISTTATDYFIFISLYGPIDSVVIANFVSAFYGLLAVLISRQNANYEYQITLIGIIIWICLLVLFLRAKDE